MENFGQSSENKPKIKIETGTIIRGLVAIAMLLYYVYDSDNKKRERALTATQPMPNLNPSEVTIDNIEQYLNKLGDNEKEQLNLGFKQLVKIYSAYNNVPVDEDLKEKLHHKFYGLFAKYCKNFVYLNESPKEGLANFSSDTIRYNLKALRDTLSDIYLTDDLPTELRFKSEEIAPIIELVAELAHAIQGDSPENQDRAKKLTDDHQRAIDSSKNNTNGVRSPVYYVYNDPTFFEFQAHNVTERAILYWLFDCLEPKATSFEAVYANLKSVYETVMKNKEIKSNLSKGQIISALIKPKQLNLIANNNSTIDTIINNLLRIKSLDFYAQRYRDEHYYIASAGQDFIKLDPESLLNLSKSISYTNTFKSICTEFISDQINVDVFSQKLQTLIENTQSSFVSRHMIYQLALHENWRDQLKNKLYDDDMSLDKETRFDTWQTVNKLISFEGLYGKLSYDKHYGN